MSVKLRTTATYIKDKDGYNIFLDKDLNQDYHNAFYIFFDQYLEGILAKYKDLKIENVDIDFSTFKKH